MSYDVNFIAILVAAGVGSVIRLMWYMPRVFGDLLQKEAGLTPTTVERVRQKLPILMLAGFLACLITSYVVAHVAEAFDAIGVIEALQVGFSMWLGFIAASYALITFQEARSIRYYAIHAGYTLVALLVMSCIIVLWP